MIKRLLVLITLVDGRTCDLIADYQLLFNRNYQMNLFAEPKPLCINAFNGKMINF